MDERLTRSSRKVVRWYHALFETVPVPWAIPVARYDAPVREPMAATRSDVVKWSERRDQRD